MKPDYFNEFIGIFVTETQDFLKSLESDLLTIENSPTNQERLVIVKNMFRSAHSIKGSALMFGLESLSQAAHALEDCFAILRDQIDLSHLEHSTITALLEGVDYLKSITNKVCFGNNEVTTEIEEISKLKSHIEKIYGKEKPPTNSPTTSPGNNAIVKIIFEQELTPVFNRLETEISQVNAESLETTVTAINEIYYQLSGVAGMLQLPDFQQIVEELRSLIDYPNLQVETLQSYGWTIAQNLQTARSQVLAGESINVIPVTITPPQTENIIPEIPEIQENNITENNQINQVNQINEINEENINDISPISAPIPVTSNTAPVSRPTIRVDLERLTEIVNLVGELVINRTNLELQESQLRSEVKRLRRRIVELNQFGGELREEYDRLSNPELSINHPNISFLHKSNNLNNLNSNLNSNLTFDILELDRYTEFHTTANEVITLTQYIAQSAGNIDTLVNKFERSTDQLRRITEQLRSRVMQMRVVSFSRAVDHLPRALREMCRNYNKEVNLLLIGRDTKIDESLLDALRDPLVHLVRNAFDHGIETPEVRIAAGKPPSGTIEIEARHQGGQTIITITDDGKGIDPEIIRQRVIEKGFASIDQAKLLSINELYEFLFWPGFSTALKTTDLSGRGVGLDVVRANLRQVRGQVKVDSRLGKGTSFILKLPLMLSIAEALLIRIDHNTIAVPLDAVEEIIHIQANQIQMAGKQTMLRWRNEYIRLVRLQDLLQYNLSHPDIPSPDPLQQNHIPVLVLASSEGVLGIAVERLVGQQEIVVKALPMPMPKPRGIVGCTILGDGRVVTILDVDDLIGQVNHNHTTAVAVSEENSITNSKANNNSQPQILIVDDSYTIRHLLALTLTRARYRIVQAKDGQDALEKLLNGLEVSLIIADIEMPRMDGFELLRRIKSITQFTHIPVAMLTSRSGFKHRQMALELGAIHYFTKPYSENQLLETIANIFSHKITK